MAPSPRYAFGDFVLEPSQQRVRRRDGSALNLTPRLFERPAAVRRKRRRAARQRCADAGAVAGPGGRGQQPEPGHLRSAARARRRPPGQPLHPDRATPRLQVHRRGDRTRGSASARALAHQPRPSLRRRPSRLSSLRSGQAALAAPGTGGQRASMGFARHGVVAVRVARHRKLALRRSSRPWPCCLSSRWHRRLATSCWKWAWPTA